MRVNRYVLKKRLKPKRKMCFLHCKVHFPHMLVSYKYHEHLNSLVIKIKQGINVRIKNNVVI